MKELVHSFIKSFFLFSTKVNELVGFVTVPISCCVICSFGCCVASHGGTEEFRSSARFLHKSCLLQKVSQNPLQRVGIPRYLYQQGSQNEKMSIKFENVKDNKQQCPSCPFIQKSEIFLSILLEEMLHMTSFCKYKIHMIQNFGLGEFYCCYSFPVSYDSAITRTEEELNKRKCLFLKNYVSGTTSNSLKDGQITLGCCF